MSRRFDQKTLAARGELTTQPALPNRQEHVFGLHPVLHVATFAGFFLWLGIMWAAFADPGLIVPFAIFGIFLGAAFVVPAMWARVDRREGPLESWSDFMREGFECMTGHLSARETMAQVLIMPAMLVLWGVAVAVIRATI